MIKNNNKNINKLEKLSEFATKFANIIFVLGILFSTLIIIYLIYRMFFPIYVVDTGHSFITLRKSHIIYIIFSYKRRSNIP